MAKDRQAAQERRAVVQRIGGALAKLRHTSEGIAGSPTTANGVLGSDCDDAERVAGAVVDEIQHAMGFGLPFCMDGEDVDNSRNFYVLNGYVANRLMRCGQAAVGNGWASREAEMPEGRHLAISRIMGEVVACVRLTGWDSDRKRVLDLFLGRIEPRDDRERVIRKFTRMMVSQDPVDLNVDAVLSSYEELYSDTEQSESPFVEERNDRCLRAVLEEVMSVVLQSDDDAHPPFIKALIAFQAILSLRPFHVGNIYMARLLFAWSMRFSGYPIAGHAPIVEFLKRWKADAISSDDPFMPRMAFEDSVRMRGRLHDWTPWFEEVLGFMRSDLERTEEMLFRMLLRRMRLQDLLSNVGWMNGRQRMILLEAILHVDAEFTYGSVKKDFDVAYASAYADLTELRDAGFLKVMPAGTTSVFVAEHDMRERVHDMLRQHAPEAYAKVYTVEGGLTEEYLEVRERVLLRMRRNMLSFDGSGFSIPLYNLGEAGWMADEPS